VCYTESAAIRGCVALTTSGNAVTGATFDIASNWLKSSNYQFGIGSGGDSFQLFELGEAVGCGFGPNYVNYVGTTGNNAPCNVNVANPTAGVWTRAREIDPASAASGLTPLLGGLAVLRGRRKIAA